MRPLLAATVTSEMYAKLRFPLFGSPKIDGIRALTQRGGVMSRSMKPIPNKKIQGLLSHYMCQYLDGEIVVGDPTAKGCFNRTSSTVMTRMGDIVDVSFYVFDSFKEPLTQYANRYQQASEQVRKLNELGFKEVRLLPQKLLHTLTSMEEYEEEALKEGFEGIMLRDPKAGYKFNRSTLKEQILVKLKRFEDAEAVIIGVEELMSNQNEATTSETGYQVRSSHKDGMVPTGTLGALIVDWNGMQLRIGTGFDATQRAELWTGRANLKGLTVKFKYQTYGMKDVPRLPVFLGFRSRLDM